MKGFRCVGYVEWDKYCQKIIKQRIIDGYLDNAPIYGDIRDFITQGYAQQYKGMVDLITAGFPCQPFSVAGKQKAKDDNRNMWPATIETIRIIRPEYVFLENVPGLLSRSHGYFETILKDLAESGYNARWKVISAAEVGAPHQRKRLWILCYPKHDGLLATKELQSFDTGSYSNETGEKETGEPERSDMQWSLVADTKSPRAGQNNGWLRKRAERVGGGEGTDEEDMADTNNQGLQRRDSEVMPECAGEWVVGEGCSWWDIDPADLPDTNQLNGDVSRYGTSKVCRDRQEQTEVPRCEVSNTASQRLHTEENFQKLERKGGGQLLSEQSRNNRRSVRPVKSYMGRVAHGVANRVDRLKALGNGQVPQVVKVAWEILKGE